MRELSFYIHVNDDKLTIIPNSFCYKESGSMINFHLPLTEKNKGLIEKWEGLKNINIKCSGEFVESTEGCESPEFTGLEVSSCMRVVDVMEAYLDVVFSNDLVR